MNTTTEKLNKKELLASFTDTSSELLQSLSSFKDDELNIVPFAGSWTAGQVGEHLLKSGSGITQILLGNTQATERPQDEEVESIAAIFLDFTKKKNPLRQSGLLMNLKKRENS